jgi:hypothetical protein
MGTGRDSHDDPFAGLGPQPVRCRWLSSDDAARAVTAEMVRLLVDDSRIGTHWPNAVYQRNILQDIAAFVGPTRAVLASPAGMVTTAIPWHDYSLASRHILVATHWLGAESGPTFGDAARYLAEETGATVVTTTCSPRWELEHVATRFPVVGPDAEKVVTLLVEDTWVEG